MQDQSQGNPKRVISFKADEIVRSWLIDKAAEGYRSVSAQIVMIIEKEINGEHKKENAPKVAAFDASISKTHSLNMESDND